jgi:glycosyltransferase involved in cell wall biosynthesis
MAILRCLPSVSARTRIVLARGHQTSPFGLRAWEELPERFEVSALVTGSTRYDLTSARIPMVPIRALRDAAPSGPGGDLIAIAAGDRYFKLDEHLVAADIVHAEDLSLWPAAQVARLKQRYGYRMALTVWETIPLLSAFRSPHARRFREQVLEAVDVYFASTERARATLLLEGVPADRIVMTQPGVDTEKFASARHADAPEERILISPGRLEWEKGHHDVLRALAAIRRELVTATPEAAASLKLSIVGSGNEQERLERHAGELGVADMVEFRSVPYDEMPALYARASGMVLASLPRSGCGLHPLDRPRCFWEEQFGMVIPEAMAAGLPLLLSDSGAIREVAGAGATYFAPGDWLGLARRLTETVLARAPASRVNHDLELVDRYSVAAAATRLEGAFDQLLSLPARP